MNFEDRSRHGMNALNEALIETFGEQALIDMGLMTRGSPGFKYWTIKGKSKKSVEWVFAYTTERVKSKDGKRVAYQAFVSRSDQEKLVKSRLFRHKNDAIEWAYVRYLRAYEKRGGNVAHCDVCDDVIGHYQVHVKTGEKETRANGMIVDKYESICRACQKRAKKSAKIAVDVSQEASA